MYDLKSIIERIDSYKWKNIVILNKIELVGTKINKYDFKSILENRQKVINQLMNKNEFIQIEFINEYLNVENNNVSNVFCNNNVGLYGIFIQNKNINMLYSISEMIHQNITFKDVIVKFLDQTDYKTNKECVYEFKIAKSDIFMIDNKCKKIFNYKRGSCELEESWFEEKNLVFMANSLFKWIKNNIYFSGEMPYKIHPYSGKSKKSNNNTIRQFMTTLCISKYSEYFNCAEAKDLYVKNLKYNISNYYCENEEKGMIFLNGTAKLGASSIAALSIYSNKEMLMEMEVKFEAILRGTEYLLNENGSFRTFFIPKERNDNQNFYPGETLLFWSIIMKEEKYKYLQEKIYNCFIFYRKWHFENRNPAFIPWNTQAYYNLYNVFPSEDIKKFIFDMNDWLIKIQQNDDHLRYDIKGRFYAPDRPQFGRPHASSTAVYLEGLVDALDLAFKCKDYDRASNYSISIKKGILNLKYLQYKNDIEKNFIPFSNYFNGSLKTSVEDGTVRLDNVQHTIDAIVKILKLEPEVKQFLIEA